MIEFKGTKQGELLEVITEGTAKQEDLAEFKEAIKNKLLQEEPLNILFVFKNIEGITSKALVEDMKTFPYIKSIHKGAIVADETFTKLDETISKLVPGVTVKHFSMDQYDEAKQWLSRD